MKFKFNIFYFISALILLAVEICIAIFLKEGFIRHTFGDFLAVILLYCGIRSLIKVSPIKLALFVIGFAFIIEFLQLFNLLDYLNLSENKWATTILGSTFHFSDLVAYTLGTLCILIIDLKTVVWKP